jgi:hypothetical protein
MAVMLRRAAFDPAKRLDRDGRVVLDERDDWSDHQPSAADENRVIAERGWNEFGAWFLGRDDQERRETKGHYKDAAAHLQACWRRCERPVIARSPAVGRRRAVVRRPAQSRRRPWRRAAATTPAGS